MFYESGVGLATVSGGPQEPQLAFVAKKKLAILDGPNTVVSAKMEIDSDLRATEVRIVLFYLISLSELHKIP